MGSSKNLAKVTELLILKGKKHAGFPAYGYLDVQKGWGGFAFYFLGSIATYAKHPIVQLSYLNLIQ